MLRTSIVLFSLIATPALSQYGGPPIWDRDYGNPEYRRALRPPPPGTPYGPQYEPCIYRGDCRGPRYRNFGNPYRYPPYPRYDD